jgi:hypothetical protein
MSQTAKLARQLLETLCDRVFEGALESMSQAKYYTFVMSDNWLLLDIYRKQASLRVASPDEPVGRFSRKQPIGSRFKPRQPRYLAHLSDTEIERYASCLLVGGALVGCGIDQVGKTLTHV